MATQTFYVNGAQIGHYSSLSMSGKSNGTKLTLGGTTPLGDENTWFRIVISNISGNPGSIVGSQVISVYAYPPTSNPEVPIYSEMQAQNNEFNGRATSASHIILDGPGNTGIFIDINGIQSGTMQYGPGLNPIRYQPFPYSNLMSTPPTFPCFAKGTLIETEIGPLPIETLRVGDRIGTMDNGLQPIRWIGKREVPATGRLAPIRFEAGAIGNYRPLLVSPQHRMLVSDWRSELHFGAAQVLIAAKHMVNGKTIRQVPMPKVTYVHMVFDRHEVVFAEGVPTESLHLGAQALSDLDIRAREELLSIFPELAGTDAETARRCLRAYESEVLAPSIMTGVRSPAA